jgi:S-methylmethionine-dependent homocysteine/selenocysteine methylase
MRKQFPQQKDGVLYLSEGGVETEIMFRYGHELPHFAMFTLLENPKAVADMSEMFRQYLDTVQQSRCNALMGGIDYRASADWGKLLGYSRESLREMQIRCIEFLRDLAGPYQGQIPEILFSGIIGPRGDAYETNHKITAEEAEDYHSEQLLALNEAEVDMTWAATFNNIPEAIGISRAAAKIGVPLCVSFTLNSHHRLNSGPSLKNGHRNRRSRNGQHATGFLRY